MRILNDDITIGHQQQHVYTGEAFRSETSSISMCQQYLLSFRKCGHKAKAVLLCAEVLQQMDSYPCQYPNTIGSVNLAGCCCASNCNEFGSCQYRMDFIQSFIYPTVATSDSPGSNFKDIKGIESWNEDEGIDYTNFKDFESMEQDDELDEFECWRTMHTAAEDDGRFVLELEELRLQHENCKRTIAELFHGQRVVLVSE